MPKIVIKDLTENVELDHKAMTAITGGARTGGRMPYEALTASRQNRLLDYPPGVQRRPLGERRSESK
ncbi:hypothetical protein [Noviherbaspirillum galbum]|uniref:Uncharacterized protein n=1 Tax=Noviherbaspirillum galbum TaxID=2709383 RepID=A0A6B3SV66_9BURK|nr:hypothetical protein [Noviherbaspirillum galbum]NEX62786.1 hypothetical protein [Noviherbaspirillum galbum]